MSIRAFITSGLGKKPQILAEAAHQLVPLSWIAIVHTADLETADPPGYFPVDRKAAMQRLEDAIPFFVELFPEFESLEAHARELLELIRKSRTAKIAVTLLEHFALEMDHFAEVMTVAVKAVEARDKKCSFHLPVREEPCPFTLKMISCPAISLKTTRDVLCRAAGLDPGELDEEMQRDQVVGHLSKKT
jgi:hypothetical protein